MANRGALIEALTDIVTEVALDYFGRAPGDLAVPGHEITGRLVAAAILEKLSERGLDLCSRTGHIQVDIHLKRPPQVDVAPNGHVSINADWLNGLQEDLRRALGKRA